MLTKESTNSNPNVRFDTLERDLEDIEKSIYNEVNNQSVHELNVNIISLEMRWDNYQIQNNNDREKHERFDYVMNRINKIRVEFNRKFMISNKEAFRFKYKEKSVEEKEMRRKMRKKVINKIWMNNNLI